MERETRREEIPTTEAGVQLEEVQNDQAAHGSQYLQWPSLR